MRDVIKSTSDSDTLKLLIY